MVESAEINNKYADRLGLVGSSLKLITLHTLLLKAILYSLAKK